MIFLKKRKKQNKSHEMNKFQNIANFRLIGRKIREKRLMRRNVSLREKIREKCPREKCPKEKGLLGRNARIPA